VELGLKKICVVGGGAAGFFAAINAAIMNPRARVSLIEGTARPLTKVKISGGGRCNVTNGCVDPVEVVKNYPRGHRELRGPMTKFGPAETVKWFESRGVELKTEMDGRVFPVSNSSQSILDCLKHEAEVNGIEVTLSSIVESVTKVGERFEVAVRNRGVIEADAVVLATGSSPSGHKFARDFGHTITETVPSLFTFNIADPRFAELSGIAFDRVELTMTVGSDHSKFSFAGPLLITHWGLSGPAVLKLSAFGAKALHDSDYQAELAVNFCPNHTLDHIVGTLNNLRKEVSKQRLETVNPFNLPKRFWSRIISFCEIPADLTCANLTSAQIKHVTRELKQGSYQISGKGVFKEEFVTCGGVSLSEVKFQTMESKLVPGLYFAGEILDIDGITGGFNFQNAWTTGWLAASALSI
jgi:predicted Rossmann fold flavoprotein